MRTFKTDLIPPPPFSLCWNLVPKDRKIGLELGAGNGLFSINFAKSNPDWFLLSFERTLEKSLKFKKLSQKFPDLKNHLYYLRADGINVVSHLIPDTSIDKIFFLYPNPYLKAKQKNQRWHNMPFFTEVIRVLKHHGEIEFRSNLKWYIEECMVKLQAFKELNLSQFEELNQKHQPETAFEKKYIDRGETCFRLIYRKT